MAGSRLPRQLFLQGVAAIYMFAFASLYTQVPGLYGPDGILPARRTLRPQGKGRWRQLWETPTLLWEAPALGLDTAQGLELLSLLGTLLALGALLLRPLRHPLVYLLLWAAYLSAYQVGQVFLYFQWDSLLLETGFLAVLVAPLRQHCRGKQALPETPHDHLPFWLVRWLLFRLMFASGVVKLTSRCPAWWGLTALTYHYETQCLPTPAAWFAHHLPVWLHKLSAVATFLIEVAVPPLFFAPTRRLRLLAFYSQVLLQVMILLTGNYNFFNLLTLVLTSALLDDQHLAARPKQGHRKKATCEYDQLSACCGPVVSPPCSYIPTPAHLTVPPCSLDPGPAGHTGPAAGAGRLRAPGLWHRALLWSRGQLAAACYPLQSHLHLPPVLPVAEDGDAAHHVAGCGLPGLGAADCPLEVHSWSRSGCAAPGQSPTARFPAHRWTRVQGWLRKLCASVELSVWGGATVALFLISLVPYSYMEPGTHGRLWVGTHRLFGAVEHLQLANSYGLFRRMTGLGGRPEVVLEGSYDGHHWTEIEFMYKPGNMSRPPPIVVPHQPRLDWQMWFAALGPHMHSPWFTSLVLRLLQGKEPVIRLIQNQVTSYPFHEHPPTYVRAQRYKYWFSQPGEQGRWWRRQWVEEFFPAVSLGDPTLETLLKQFGLQDKSPPRARGSGTLAQALHWVRAWLCPLEPPMLLWGLLVAVGTIRALQALLPGSPLHSSPPASREKHKPAPNHSNDTSQASPAPSPCSTSRASRRKK
ncbi:lipase maturation factor 2 isoform X1 [Ochotona curzoniae]|uniref:lipase maturation factor 2 isoform X1 n=1 Tax=Ochotona curzoniae TaxID=130825 RepID=UPI001B34F577|nr:lipase maturation factor 2 isoform X1 [Ochotona curzoniae]